MPGEYQVSLLLYCRWRDLLSLLAQAESRKSERRRSSSNTTLIIQQHAGGTGGVAVLSGRPASSVVRPHANEMRSVGPILAGEPFWRLGPG